MRTLPFSVIIPTLASRPLQLQNGVRKIMDCFPGPEEILIHVDGMSHPLSLDLPGDSRIKIIGSLNRIGPGGGRQRLLEMAACQWIASFDDDSWPESPLFFQQAADFLSQHPEVAILSAASNEENTAEIFLKRTSTYAGCGCIFVKSWMKRIPGFLPLPCAYGMEEVDVSLQIHQFGGLLVTDTGLRVKHARQPLLESDSCLSSQAFSNNVLFTYIRVPWLCLPINCLRVLAYAFWLIKRNDLKSVIKGIVQSFSKIRQFSRFRYPVTSESFVSWLMLSQHSQRIIDDVRSSV